MRALLALFFAVSGCSMATAAAPGQSVGHELATGITIEFPRDWQFESFPMPMAGASNYRVTAGGLRMAITGFPLPPVPQGEKFPFDGEEGKAKVIEIVANTAGQFAPLASDGSVEPTPVLGDGFLGAYATLNSKGGDAVFPVFSGRVYACVTTGMVITKTTAFSVSIGSPSCSGADHKAALAALSSIVVKI